MFCNCTNNFVEYFPDCDVIQEFSQCTDNVVDFETIDRRRADNPSFDITKGEDSLFASTKENNLQINMTKGDNSQFQMAKANNSLVDLTKGDNSELENNSPFDLAKQYSSQFNLYKRNRSHFEIAKGYNLQVEAIKGDNSELEMKMEPPSPRVVDDIEIPADFEIRQSQFYSGLGIWTKTDIPTGTKLGPFAGIIRASIEDPSCAWEVRLGFCFFQI